MSGGLLTGPTPNGMHDKPLDMRIVDMSSYDFAGRAKKGKDKEKVPRDGVLLLLLLQGPGGSAGAGEAGREEKPRSGVLVVGGLRVGEAGDVDIGADDDAEVDEDAEGEEDEFEDGSGDGEDAFGRGGGGEGMRGEETGGKEGREGGREGGGKRHECPHCKKRFNRPSSLRIHMNTHTGAKREYFFFF